jgi:hypothetical protein
MSKAGLSPEEQKDMTAARTLLKERDRLALKKNFPPLSVAVSTPRPSKRQVFFYIF